MYADSAVPSSPWSILSKNYAKIHLALTLHLKSLDSRGMMPLCFPYSRSTTLVQQGCYIFFLLYSAIL